MEPSGHLDLQPRMKADETGAVVEALRAGGQTVRFVGGCVRDAVLERAVKDIDFATPDPPETVIERLEQAGLGAVPTGIEHGTVTAVVGEAHFEITTLRRDVETFGRRARVEFTDDWAADATRRDFTINALFCDPDGTLYDPTGGLADLTAGRVRFIGDPTQRIDEDVLRILRFFRFHAWYGQGAPDQDGLAACRALAHRLPELSGERVAGELFRLLDAVDPMPVVGAMAESGVLAQVLPEADNLEHLRRLCRIETAALAPDHVRRLAALVSVNANGAEVITARLRLSNRQRDRLAFVAAPIKELRPGITIAAARAAVYRFGLEYVEDSLLLAWAEEGGDEVALKRLVGPLHDWVLPKFPVRGKDVQALGIPHGPEVGRLLEAVEDWWIGEDFRPDREAALDKLDSLVRDSERDRS